MEVYSFINSTAMQDYLRKINYKFSGFEAAWLIYRSNRSTLAEKHAAWQEIIDTWPDEESDMPHMPNRPSQQYTRYKLHETLKEQITRDNAMIKAITDNVESESKYIYYYTRIYEEGKTDSRSFFSSYDLAYNDVKKHFCKGDEYSKIIITRRKLDDEHNKYYITISNNGDILNVDNDVMLVYAPAFENLLFEFPTPFKKGDILYNPYCRNKTPFVFIKALSNEEVRKDFRYSYLNHCPKNYASLYMVDNFGRIEFNDFGVPGEYTSFEYYNGKSDTRTSVLNLLSKHLKTADDPDGVKFAQAYAQTIAKGWANEIQK